MIYGCGRVLGTNYSPAPCCQPSPALLRPSSADFPKLALRAQEGATKVRESERLLGEKVTRKTEEYVDEASGMIKVRTVEYVEKLIEKEVLND